MYIKQETTWRPIVKTTLPPVRTMHRASISRDKTYDGIFFVAVRTTGIFCRPSCPARTPFRKNVEYYATAREALFAGYRPCKRCRPLETDGAIPEWVSRILARVDKNPSLRFRDRDVRAAGVDPARIRRHFLKTYGMTFQAYCRGRRLGSSLEQIRLGKTLDDVALGNGYESHSGFRDAFVRTFGTTPGKSRSGDCIVCSWIETPLGPMVAGATSHGLCLLEFTDRRMLETQFAVLRKRFQCAVVPGTNAHINNVRKQLADYFKGARRKFSVPLVHPGTPFQQRVWNTLKRIPHGTTMSYEELAVRVGSPGAWRAAGTANGMNRIAILVPCHRVLNKNGELGGYGGGLWRKQRLLELERNGKGRPLFEKDHSD